MSVMARCAPFCAERRQHLHATATRGCVTIFQPLLRSDADILKIMVSTDNHLVRQLGWVPAQHRAVMSLAL